MPQGRTSKKDLFLEWLVIFQAMAIKDIEEFLQAFQQVDAALLQPLASVTPGPLKASIEKCLVVAQAALHEDVKTSLVHAIETAQRLSRP